MQTDTLAPCHICGERPRVIGDARGLLGDNAWRVTCHPSTAIYPTRDQAVAAWNDDARAREVLRAVETLAPYYVKVRASELPSEWVASAQREALEYALGASPVDAMIALAQQIGARDAE